MSKVVSNMSRSRFAAIMLFAILMVSAFGCIQNSNGGHGVLPAPVSVAHADDIWDIKIENGELNQGANSKDKDGVAQVNDMLDKGKFIAMAITGGAAIVAFIFMIIQITKLVGAGDNDQARRKAIGGILTSGIGLALLGSATMVIGFFWNVFKSTP